MERDFQIHLLALDVLEHVDQSRGIETRQVGQRLAEHLLGQGFQAADPQTADLAGQLVRVVDLFLGRAVAAVAIGLSARGRARRNLRHGLAWGTVTICRSLLSGQFLGDRLPAGGISMHDPLLKGFHVIEDKRLIQFDFDVARGAQRAISRLADFFGDSHVEF